MSRQSEAGGDLLAEFIAPAAAYEHVAVPDEIASARVLWSALIWGWVWAVAHRLYGWALADFVLSFAVFASMMFATDVEQWPIPLYAFAVLVVCWFALRINLARRAPVEAWRRRAFRDVREFRTVQTVWLWAAGLIVIGAFALATAGSALMQMFSAACGPGG